MGSSSDRDLLWPVVWMLGIAVFVCALWSRDCEDREGAHRALKGAGFTEIELGPWKWLACGSGDVFNNSFKAINPRGQRVSGVVCCGLWKRCTVRY